MLSLVIAKSIKAWTLEYSLPVNVRGEGGGASDGGRGGKTVGLEWGSLLGNETIIVLGHQLKQCECRTKAYVKNEKMEEEG